MRIYRKLRKLFSNPRLFFTDFNKNRLKEVKKVSNNLKPISLVNRIIKEKNFVLIYAPINNSGLYQHLIDLIEILNKQEIAYIISWHSKPKLDSVLNSYYIDYEESKKLNPFPSLVINLERYNNAYPYQENIFYINLDWLSKKDFLFSKIHSDMILYPNQYKINLLKKTFFNQYFCQLNWLSNYSNNVDADIESNNAQNLEVQEKKIRILFFAKSIQNHRSNAEYVLKAFKNYKKENINLTIKTADKFFFTNKNITVITDYLNKDQISELYNQHDLVLIPNSCEGNGLLIFEALQHKCIPVVIDGYPMKTLVEEQYAYLLPFLYFIRQKYAKYYIINTSVILNFFNQLKYDDVVKKKKYLSDNYQSILKNRQKNVFTTKVEGILDYYDLIDEHFHRKSKIRVSTSDERKKIIEKRKFIIDVFVTSYNRYDFFKECINSVNEAIKKTKHQIRVHIFLDALTDERYYEIIKKHKFNYYIYNKRLGLPYILHQIKFILWNVSERLTHKSKFFCYLQDDCLINSNINYFDDMVSVSLNSIQKKHLNFVTGFHNKIHPGLDDFETLDQKKCRLSNSIDGKNIFGYTNTLLKIPKFSFFNNAYRKQGNPGPANGSNFDLWLWRDNIVSKGKKNIIYKNAILLNPKSKVSEFSSWKNSELDKDIQLRQQFGKIYK